MVVKLIIISLLKLWQVKNDFTKMVEIGLDFFIIKSAALAD
jgi:hypothetical protein